MKIRRKLLALLMTLAMVLTYMPALAFADTSPEGDDISEFPYMDLICLDEHEVLYSDGTISYKIPEELEIPAGSDIEINVGTVTFSEDGNPPMWDLFGNDTYSFDSTNRTLTIYGNEVAKEDHEWHVDVGMFCTSGTEGNDDFEVHWTAGTHFDFREARAEYPFPEDRDMLVDWDEWINAEDNAWVENAQHPDGDDVPYMVTGVESSDPDVVKVESEEDGWNCRAIEKGEAEITIKYQDIIGEDEYSEEKTYYFLITVTEDVYGCNLWINGDSDKYLPGDSVELETRIVHYNHDLEGGEADITNDVDLTWSLPDEGTDYASITPKEGEGNKAVVTFKTKEALANAGLLDEGGDLWCDINARVVASKEGNNLASSDHQLTVSTDYMEIAMVGKDASFGRLCGLEIGESMTFGLELRHYTSDADEYSIVPDAEFEWEYDENCASISGPADGKYTVTRTNDYEGWIKVTARWTDDLAREESRDMNFSRKDYDFWFAEHDIDAFTDAEQIAVDLDVSNLPKNLGEYIGVDFTVGVWDDENNDWADGGTLTKGTDYTVSDVSEGIITVALNRSYYEALTDYTNIHLVAGLRTGTGDGAHSRENDAWFHIRVPETDWAREEDMSLLPGWDSYIDSEYELTIFNSEHPDGDFTSYTVKGAAVTEQDPEESNKEVIKIDTADDGWKITALNPGKATVTVTHSPFNIDGKEQTSYSFDVYVINDVYNVEIVNGSNNWDGLPGDMFALEADALHFYQDESGEQQSTKEGLTYQWKLGPEAEGIADITADSSDPSKATLKFKSIDALPEDLQDQEWFERRVDIAVLVSDTGREDPDEVVAEQDIDFRMTREYEEIKPAALSDEIRNLKPGESADIEFSTVTRRAGEADAERDDVRYRIFFDQSNPLTVKDAEGKPVGHGDRITGNKITITRDNALSTALGVRAEADNNSGDPNDFRILGFRNYQFDLDEETESARISGLADAAETAADDAAEKAELAAGAVDALKDAAEAAKTAADKAAQSLDAADIADAQAKTAAAEEAQTAAAAAIEAAEAAKTAADEAVETAKAAIAGAEKQHVPIDEIARTKVNDASKSAGDTAAGITSAQAEKASQDAVVSKASATASKAASDKAAADKAADDAAKAKAAAEKAEADRKAAEYAANGNAYIDPTLPKVKIKGPKKAKKSFTAKWKKLGKKQQKKVKGVEIEYSLTPDFQNPLFKTAGKKKTSVKVKKLQSKKTYYVRAHTYVIRNGQKYVSNWSAAKKVKVK